MYCDIATAQTVIQEVSYIYSMLGTTDCTLTPIEQETEHPSRRRRQGMIKLFSHTI